MIIKNNNLNKETTNKYNLFLFYGNNDGLKEICIQNLIDQPKAITNYDEKDILDNKESFFESFFSKSLFEKQKIYIIKRVTEKILNLIIELQEKNLDSLIILISDNLEKKSKLRSYFEKNKKLACIAFYPDNEKTLSILAHNFCKEKKIPISQNLINQIINLCGGNRVSLFNELIKLENFSKKGKKIDSLIISKLINLSENHEISELVDNSLAKNIKKTKIILNENTFNKEDTVLIIKIFLNKTKKLLKLVKEFKKNNNIDIIINSAKPPIFWKDKEIVKKQIYSWNPDDTEKLIYKINKIELIIKKNLNSSLLIITDFILETASN